MDPRALSFRLTRTAVRLICHRNRGVGSDGILTIERARRAQFGMRIFNPDGSEAEKSGNGVRIFVKCLWDHGYTRRSRFTVDTRGGLVSITLQLRGRRIHLITAEMGRATFRSREIPVAGPDRDVVDEEIAVDSQEFRFTGVSVGNPHCVVFVDDLESVDLPRVGPGLEHHPMFPHRTNVQFVRVDSPSRVTIRIWERGAGETMASGSSSSAVAAACVLRGFTGPDVAVHSPGGILRVHVAADFAIRLTGPAEEISRGTISPDLLLRLRG
ncbi:MAG: diaminopimelate epimerase [Bacillati bacterium ANGP1]|uniref:Diaminopimelate epimerase n=1 Tax=Candidatus Segetimicrobium genomatis TaxID=2569760 RepID=A0A537J4N5_9BACT|nr:MAG: diaminopimelate epimerase [Terrabacteria group bacterium ANGP1]